MLPCREIGEIRHCGGHVLHVYKLTRVDPGFHHSAVRLGHSDCKNLP